MKVLCIKLIQQTKFFGKSQPFGNETKSKTKIENREVAALTYPEKIEAFEKQTWIDHLKIPAICSSSNPKNNLSKIIVTNYIVRLHFDFKTLDVSTDLTIPVTIGTIPYKEIPSSSRKKFDESDGTESGSSDESDEDEEDSDDSADLPMPTLPSLSYEPDMYENDSKGLGGLAGAGDMVKTDEHSFKPLYPYYSYD